MSNCDSEQNNTNITTPDRGHVVVTTKTKGTFMIRYVPSPFDRPIEDEDTSGRWQGDQISL